MWTLRQMSKIPLWRGKAEGQAINMILNSSLDLRKNVFHAHLVTQVSYSFWLVDSFHNLYRLFPLFISSCATGLSHFLVWQAGLMLDDSVSGVGKCSIFFNPYYLSIVLSNFSHITLAYILIYLFSFLSFLQISSYSFFPTFIFFLLVNTFFLYLFPYKI